MNLAWYDIVGFLGVLCIVLAYFLIQTGKLESSSISYSILNGTGASLVLLSLYYDFNFPSFVVEFFWLLISILGLIRALRSKDRQPAD